MPSETTEVDESRYSLHVINKNRVEVRDSVTNTVAGEAVRYGREDWFVSASAAKLLIGRVHSHHVNEIQGRKMILGMLKAYYNIGDE